MKWKEVAPGAAWLCPGWEVAAGFGSAWEGPLEVSTLGAPPEEKEALLAQACKQLGRLAGLGETTAWAFLHQVHGVALKKAQGVGPGQAQCLGEGDGAWTEQPGLALAVQTADCVPLLLMDRRLGRVAAVHAGWRGVWGRIIIKQLEAWFEEGSLPGEVAVALGPCIGPCCYEVSEELGKRFEGRWGGAVVSPTPGEQGRRVDLAKALELDMVGAGVLPGNVQTARVCTFCDKRFHSYRRQKGKAGRQLSWVQCLRGT